MNTRREVVGALRELGAVAERPHLGGWALELDGARFGIWQRQRLWLLADGGARAEHLRHGMMPLQPNPQTPEGNFYQVPPAVASDPDQLRVWARRAVAAAQRKGL